MIGSWTSVTILSDDEPGYTLQSQDALHKNRRLTYLTFKEFLAGSSFLLATFFLGLAVFIVSYFVSSTGLPCQRPEGVILPLHKPAPSNELIYVAFVGNSFTFWNRMPALVGELGAGNARVYACVHSDSSLKSITDVKTKEVRADNRTNPPEYVDSVEQLLLEGASGWDAVVLQDHSRGPIEAREEGIAALRDIYVPLLKPLRCARPNATQTHCLRTVVLFTTWSYDDKFARDFQLTTGYGSYANANSKGLSDFAHKLHAGYLAYAAALQEELPGIKVVLAPVGLAFEVVRTLNGTLWHDLYSREDAKHPSPAGTFLIASVIYGTLQTVLEGPGTDWLGRLRGQGSLMASWTQTAIDAGWAPQTEEGSASFGSRLKDVPSVESQLLGSAGAAVGSVADALMVERT